MDNNNEQCWWWIWRIDSSEACTMMVVWWWWWSTLVCFFISIVIIDLYYCYYLWLLLLLLLYSLYYSAFVSIIIVVATILSTYSWWLKRITTGDMSVRHENLISRMDPLWVCAMMSACIQPFFGLYFWRYLFRFYTWPMAHEIRPLQKQKHDDISPLQKIPNAISRFKWNRRTVIIHFCNLNDLRWGYPQSSSIFPWDFPWQTIQLGNDIISGDPRSGSLHSPKRRVERPHGRAAGQR